MSSPVFDTNQLVNFKCDPSGADYQTCIADHIPVHPAFVDCKRNGGKFDNSSNSTCARLTVFGSHHKMGTEMGYKITNKICNRKVRCRLVLHSQVKHYKPGAPFIHFIRDPLEVVVSGYQYHLISTEQWLFTTGYQARLHNMSLDEGLETEFHRADEKDLTMAAKLHEHSLSGKKNVRGEDFFIVRLEDIRKEHLFQATVAAIQKWMGLRNPVPWHAMEKCCYASKEQRESGSNPHLSKTEEKPLMRQKVMENHADEIVQYRKRLGFPLVGSEAKKQTNTTIENSGKDVGSAVDGSGGKDLGTAVGGSGKDLGIADSGNDLSIAIDGSGKNLGGAVDDSGKGLDTTFVGSGKNLSIAVDDSRNNLSIAVDGSGKDLGSAVDDSGKGLNTTFVGSGKNLSIAVDESGNDLSIAVDGSGKGLDTTFVGSGKNLSIAVDESGNDLSIAIDGSGKNLGIAADDSEKNIDTAVHRGLEDPIGSPLRLWMHSNLLAWFCLVCLLGMKLTRTASSNPKKKRMF